MNNNNHWKKTDRQAPALVTYLNNQMNKKLGTRWNTHNKRSLFVVAAHRGRLGKAMRTLGIKTGIKSHSKLT